MSNNRNNINNIKTKINKLNNRVVPVEAKAVPITKPSIKATINARTPAKVLANSRAATKVQANTKVVTNARTPAKVLANSRAATKAQANTRTSVTTPTTTINKRTVSKEQTSVDSPPSYTPTPKPTIKKTLNKVKNFSSEMVLKLKNGAKKLHGVSSNKTLNTILKMTVGIMFLITLVILALFYNTLNKHFKSSAIYLVYSLMTLLVSLFIMPLLFSETSTIGQVISLVIIGIATIFFAIFTKKYIEYLKSFRKDSPYLIKNMKNAKKSLVIEQNPDNEENVIIYRSDNEDGGIEFSYSFWILVNDFTFKDKNMKHVFHKGDSKAQVSYTPAVWIHPDKNALRINMNTLQSKDNIIDIDNLPINKWVHLSIIVKQKIVTIYVNGNIKKSKRLESIPRQNFGNVWVNLFGGFDGYLSNLKYTRRALSYSEVENMVSEGPSTKSSAPSEAEPPYLDDNWWLK